MGFLFYITENIKMKKELDNLSKDVQPFIDEKNKLKSEYNTLMWKFCKMDELKKLDISIKSVRNKIRDYNKNIRELNNTMKENNKLIYKAMSNEAKDYLRWLAITRFSYIYKCYKSDDDDNTFKYRITPIKAVHRTRYYGDFCCSYSYYSCLTGAKNPLIKSNEELTIEELTIKVSKFYKIPKKYIVLQPSTHKEYDRVHDIWLKGNKIIYGCTDNKGIIEIYVECTSDLHYQLFRSDE